MRKAGGGNLWLAIDGYTLALVKKNFTPDLARVLEMMLVRGLTCKSVVIGNDLDVTNDTDAL